MFDKAKLTQLILFIILIFLTEFTNLQTNDSFIFLSRVFL